MRILVTGHLGYIGTVLVPMLLRQGHDVVGMDSDLFHGCTFGEEPTPVPTVRKDIRDATLDDLRGVDAVCHLAALSNDPLGNLNADLTYDINFRASLKLAELAKKAGARRFIFSSSCSNYGAGGDDLLDETAAFNPVTPYGESKVLTEQSVAPLASDSFSPVFLRNATAYGVSPRLRFDLVVNNLVAWAMCTGKIMLKSDGTPWRPLVHVEDICRGFVAALHAPRDTVHGQAFNIGRTDQNLRIREVAEIVGETVPNCHVEFASGASPDKRNYRVTCDKAGRELKDFKPQWDVRSGAKQLYETYKRVGLTLDEFEGPTFQRIGRIRKLMEEGALDASLRFRTPALALN